MSLRRRMKGAEAWLSPARLAVGAWTLAVCNVLGTLVWLATSRGLMDRFHQPVGGDFVIFYATARLTALGQPLAAFSHPALLAAEHAAVAGTPSGLWWCYPPSFQLLLTPLAGLPFAWAYALWSAVGVTGYLVALRRFSTDRRLWLFALAFPGVFVAAWQGQTSLFVLAVLGLGLMALDRRPWLAGFILSLAACKPQFALLLPVILIATGRWRSLVAAALGASALALASLAAFGVSAWTSFFAHLPEVSQGMTAGQLPWAKMPSIFVALSWLGAPEPFALAIHAAIALPVAAATLIVWRGRAPLALKTASAVCASLIVTPYSFNYDLVLLAIPVVVLAEEARRRAPPPGEILTLLMAVLGPNLLFGVSEATHVQFISLVVLALFVAVCRAAGRYAPARRDRGVAAPGDFGAVLGG